MTDQPPNEPDTPATPETEASKTPPPSHARKRPTGLIVLLVIVIATVFVGYKYKYQASLGPAGVEQDVNLIGGPFTLTDHDGKVFTEQNLLGRYSLIFFGYTFCPDVCPTTLSDLTEALTLLGQDADKVRPLFVSVDPGRDTAEYIKEYVSYFHPNVLGLTGTEEQIKQAAKAYRVYYAREKGEADADEEDYTISHSSIVYLMGPDGKFMTHFSYGTDPSQIAQKILELM